MEEIAILSSGSLTYLSPLTDTPPPITPTYPATPTFFSLSVSHYSLHNFSPDSLLGNITLSVSCFAPRYVFYISSSTSHFPTARESSSAFMYIYISSIVERLQRVSRRVSDEILTNQLQQASFGNSYHFEKLP